MHHDKTSLNPYLTFNGNCAKAVNFYKEALDGELEIMTFEGSPITVPEGYEKKIMHATLKFGYAVLMASDGMPNHKVVEGNTVHLSIAAISEEDGERYFKNLSEGGQIVMPYEKSFWGAKFGMCIDKFGMNWMVNVEMKEEK